MPVERLLFVIPPYFSMDNYNSRSGILPPFTVPYGVLSLYTYLKDRFKNTVEAKVIDLNIYLREELTRSSVTDLSGLSEHLLTEHLKDFTPSIVGISALFNTSFRYMENLARAIKSEYGECLIVAGGGLPSAAYREVLGHCPSVDAICKGEGEIPLSELVGARDKAELLESHPSWLTRKGLSEGKIPVHTFVENLDEIPMLDYSLIKLDDYNSRSIDKRFSSDEKREMSIHTSRGCPFSCVFCSNPSLHGNKVRSTGVGRVINEIKVMKERHGMTVLLIEDDHFFFDKKRAKQILKDLSSLNIRIEFPNGIAVYSIDEEIAALLSVAGTSTVALAVESGSDYVLKHIIGKPLNKEIVREKVEMLRRYGVQCHVFIVIGLPGEMPEHRKETLELLLNVGFDWAHVFCAVPIFGSRLYDICIENGYLNHSGFLEHVNTKCVITAPGVDPEEIEKTAYEFNLIVNFVNNYNLKMGNYETAIKYFSNVTSRYPEHAFGHYYLAKALEGVGNQARADEESALFKRIVSNDPWWRTLGEKFGLAHDTNSRVAIVSNIAPTNSKISRTPYAHLSAN